MFTSASRPYTLEFKQEACGWSKRAEHCGGGAHAGRGGSDAVQLGQGPARAGQAHGRDSKVVSAEQMEISRLRAELARVKMERDILGKATAYFAKAAK
jgi:transposase